MTCVDMGSEGTAVSDKWALFQICHFSVCILLANTPRLCAAIAAPCGWPYPVPGEAVRLTLDTTHQKHLYQ